MLGNNQRKLITRLILQRSERSVLPRSDLWVELNAPNDGNSIASRQVQRVWSRYEFPGGMKNLFFTSSRVCSILMPNAVIRWVSSWFAYWNDPRSITVHLQSCPRYSVVLLSRSKRRGSALNYASAASRHTISNSMFSVSQGYQNPGLLVTRANKLRSVTPDIISIIVAVLHRA